MKAADYAGFPSRKAQSAAQGKRRGVGVGCFLEFSGGMLQESAAIRFPGQGAIVVSIAPTAQGQGHKTVFGNVVAKKLGLPLSAITVQYGDSDRDVPGLGAVASRSAMLVGSAVSVTADLVIAKGKAAAAVLLQADPDTVSYAEGVYSVPGSGRAISLLEVAARSGELVTQGAIKEPMDTTGNVTTAPSYPNGCHIAEVEIDPDTGAVTVARYTAVGDCGNVLDQVILEGQVHGGIAQGLARRCWSRWSTMPPAVRSRPAPSWTTACRAPLICRRSPWHCRASPAQPTRWAPRAWAKAGTTAAPCALVNAVVDALGREPSFTIDMPLTPEKIWRALQT